MSEGGDNKSAPPAIKRLGTLIVEILPNVLSVYKFYAFAFFCMECSFTSNHLRVSSGLRAR